MQQPTGCYRFSVPELRQIRAQAEREGLSIRAFLRKVDQMELLDLEGED